MSGFKEHYRIKRTTPKGDYTYAEKHFKKEDGAQDILPDIGDAFSKECPRVKCIQIESRFDNDSKPREVTGIVCEFTDAIKCDKCGYLPINKQATSIVITNL